MIVDDIDVTVYNRVRRRNLMPNTIGQRHKHFRFKMRATKELPSREFAVEFTSTHMDVRKVGKSHSTNRVRWGRLIGAMLIFGNNASGLAVGEGSREFLVELTQTGHPTAVFEVHFGPRGLKIFRDGVSTIWAWRTILNFALSGGGM
jgi:hypothetical protein